MVLNKLAGEEQGGVPSADRYEPAVPSPQLESVLFWFSLCVGVLDSLWAVRVPSVTDFSPAQEETSSS